MKKYDQIVIGGGIIGSSLCYYLSKLGQKVLLIEKNDLCSGSAGATDGYITPHTKQPGYHLDACIPQPQRYAWVGGNLKAI